MKKYIYIIVVLLAFVSCQDISVTHVAGPYYFVVTDTKEDRKLSYSPAEGSYVGGVPPTVYAVWHNDDYIIAKQHPRDRFRITAQDIEEISRDCERWAKNRTEKPTSAQNTTLYYIIPLKNPVSEFPDENFISPLDKMEYEKKIKELKITDKITFEEID